MTPDQVNERLDTELKHVALREDIAALRIELHKELHGLTWRFLWLMTAQTGLVLGAIYFMLTHLK